MSAQRAPVVHSISTAPVSAGEDMRARTRRYLLMMGIRTACFLLMCLAAAAGQLWVAGALAIGAVILPYPAVVLANNTDRRSRAGSHVVPERHILTGPPTAPASETSHSEGASQRS